MVTCTRFSKCCLALTTIVAIQLAGLAAARAQQPEMVEATFMFLIHYPYPADPADLLPSPAGEDAIGLVLGQGQDLGDCIYSEYRTDGPDWVWDGGFYVPTDGR